MKLYSADMSPFAARVRAAIYFKNLPIEILPPPPAGLRSREYLAINPMGRLPTLVLDNGTTVPESETIIEYLEDAFPTPPLRPASAEDRAHVRLLARIAEIYINAPMFLLFPQLSAAPRDTNLVDTQLRKVDEGLGFLSGYLNGGRYAFGDRLTTADCCLFPTLHLVQVLGALFGKPELLGAHAKAVDYLKQAKGEPVLLRVFDEMTAAMKTERHDQQAPR